jgi:Ca-activated chloride channel family protein
MKALSALRLLALLAGFLPLLFLSPLPLGAAPAAPGTEDRQETMKTDAALDLQPQYRQSVLAPGSEKVELVIQVKAMAAPGQERAPLSVALVIDSSDSMYGDQLFYAQIAAITLVRQLNDQDMAALVAYGTRVKELFPAALMTPANRQRILYLIRSLKSSGGTFMSGGLEAGFRQMGRAANPGQKRIILLSDGVPSAGETDPAILADLAARIRQAGMSLTTMIIMNFGNYYNENLMQLLAQRGGGNYYRIRNPEDTELYFAGEIQDIMAGVSKDTRLTLNLNDNVLEARVYGYTPERQGQEYRLDIDDFHGDEERWLRVKLTIKPAPESRVLELGSLTLRYQPLAGNGTPESVVVPLRVEISPDQARQQASLNRQVEAWILAAQVDANYSKALDALQDYSYARAEAMVAENKALLDQNPLTAGSEILQAKQEAMEVESRRIAGLAKDSIAQLKDYLQQARQRMYRASRGRDGGERIGEGSRGAAVALLQKALSSAGVYSGPIDGIFTPAVSAAVRRFQSANGLSADGVAGPRTREKLGLY